MAQSNNDLRLETNTTYEAGVVQAAAFRMLKRFTDECLADYGISSAQWFIIGSVYAAGDAGIRITELAKIVDTTLSFLTNSVNQLEAKGYLERVEDPKDSRSKNVYVPSAMRPKIAKIEADLREKMRTGLYRTIDRNDLQTYLKVLHQISHLQIQPNV